MFDYGQNFFQVLSASLNLEKSETRIKQNVITKKQLAED